jgi:hypothetical protein
VAVGAARAGVKFRVGARRGVSRRSAGMDGWKGSMGARAAESRETLRRSPSKIDY